MIKKVTFCFILSFITTLCYSQKSFEKGSITTNSGEIISCFIENLSWSLNPQKISYKKTIDGEAQQMDMLNFTSFEIDNKSKYIKATVDLDISSDNLSNLSYVREPVYEKRQVLLNVLIEGEASLYYYADHNSKSYFYRKNEGKILELIYKKYNNFTRVNINEKYKQQLYVEFKNCSSLKRQDFEGLIYKLKSLVSLFKKYNSCRGNEPMLYSAVDKPQKSFFLKAKAGINYFSYEYTNSTIPTLSADFGNSLGYRLEIEGEFQFQFNKSEWAVFAILAKNANIETTVEIRTSSLNLTQDATFRYSNTEIGIGLRKYFNTKGKSKVSLHTGYAMNFVSELEIDYEISPDLSEFRVSRQFMAGAGYHYDKFSLEGRINFGKYFFKSGTSKISDLNLILAYTIF